MTGKVYGELITREPLLITAVYLNNFLVPICLQRMLNCNEKNINIVVVTHSPNVDS